MTSQHESKLEEGAADQDIFNLDEFLRGVTSADAEAGKKPKNLGLIWRDLMVEVIKIKKIHWSVQRETNWERR